MPFRAKRGCNLRTSHTEPNLHTIASHTTTKSTSKPKWCWDVSEDRALGSGGQWPENHHTLVVAENRRTEIGDARAVTCLNKNGIWNRAHQYRNRKEEGQRWGSKVKGHSSGHRRPLFKPPIWPTRAGHRAQTPSRLRAEAHELAAVVEKPTSTHHARRRILRFKNRRETPSVNENRLG